MYDFLYPYLDSNADPLLENSAQMGGGETGPVVQGQRPLCTQIKISEISHINYRYLIQDPR